MKIRFHLRSRRGLGHLARSSAIAEALALRWPDATVELVPSHTMPADFPLNSRVHVRNPDETSLREPADIDVYDTVEPREFREDAAAKCLVLREVRDEILRDYRERGVFDRFDVILIPHHAHEFDPGLDHAHHVGPVFRSLEAPAEVVESIPRWISTAGGGGYRELTQPFLELAAAADERLRREGIAFEHVMIPGPRYEGPIPNGDFHVERFVADLPVRMSRAAIVVSRAGYNTVHELLGTRTPFVLVPGNPRMDDQWKRARRLEEAGIAQIVAPDDVESLVALVREALTRPGRRPGSSISSGAEQAADFLKSWWNDRLSTRQNGDLRNGASGEPATLTPSEVIEALGADRLGEGVVRLSEGFATRDGGRIRDVIRNDSLTDVIAKTYLDETGARLAESFGRNGRALPVAAVLGYSSASRTLFLERAAGRRLDEVVGTTDEATAFAATGRALATLHEQVVEGLPLQDRDHLLAFLRPSPADFPEEIVDLAVSCVAWMRAEDDPVIERARLVHRDLHLRQVFVEGSQACFVDLDLAGLGHPAIDLANFELYLRTRLPDRANELLDAFRSGYRDGGGEESPRAERFYRVFTLLRMSAKVLREAHRVDHARHLLEWCVEHECSGSRT